VLPRPKERTETYSETADLVVFVGVVHAAFILDLDVWRWKTQSGRWSRRWGRGRWRCDTLRLE
jgi:hypothetical protein